MPHTAYPLDADISALVTNSGVTLPSGFVFTGYADAAQAEFEARTGRIPFLEDASDVSRTFDPPGDRPHSDSYVQSFGGQRRLELHAGLLSVTSLVGPGRTFVQDTDFRLMPVNATVQ